MLRHADNFSRSRFTLRFTFSSAYFPSLLPLLHATTTRPCIFARVPNPRSNISLSFRNSNVNQATRLLPTELTVIPLNIESTVLPPLSATFSPYEPPPKGVAYRRWLDGIPRTDSIPHVRHKHEIYYWRIRCPNGASVSLRSAFWRTSN